MNDTRPETRTPEIASPAGEGRRLGLAARAEALAALTGFKIVETVRTLGCGAAGLAVEDVLSPATTSVVLADLECDGGWSEECWVLEANGDVRPVPAAEFEVAPLDCRFSRSDCLRKPAGDAYGLRGLLSAIVSNEARESLSRAFGEEVRFRSADIARYRAGHYLRRHSDTFGERRFGIVWFLSPGWSCGNGGELVIEGPAGDATVVFPRQGAIGALAIRPNCFHLVSRIRATDWVRYSIATHFGAVGKASP